MAWWGPNAVPEDHVLADKTNSIICQPAEEDTMISTLSCTSWIKLLIGANPQLVVDVYSESGEIILSCHELGILAIRVQECVFGGGVPTLFC